MSGTSDRPARWFVPAAAGLAAGLTLLLVTVGAGGTVLVSAVKGALALVGAGGLFFVDSMVREYRGDIHVEENEAGGATFVIQLPAADATAPV